MNQNFKNFVKKNKLEIACAAGVIAGTVALTVVFRKSVNKAIVGEQWEAVQAFTDTVTGDLIIVVNKFNKTFETITIPIKKEG